MIADSINSLLWALVMLVIIMYAAREPYGFTLLSKGDILPRDLYITASLTGHSGLHMRHQETIFARDKNGGFMEWGLSWALRQQWHGVDRLSCDFSSSLG